jgi:hypothetical protein
MTLKLEYDAAAKKAAKAADKTVAEEAPAVEEAAEEAPVAEATDAE